MPTTPLPPEELKPRKGTFIYPKIAFWTLPSAMAGVIISSGMVLAELSAWPGVLMFVAGTVLGVVASLVAYRKERYEIGNNRVIRHQGGLVSDQTTELEIRNITCVKVKLPWLRHKLFGVGNLIIESAGTSEPIVMCAIRDPETHYHHMRRRMMENGYHLTQRELIHHEQPAIAGIIAEAVGMMFGAVFFALYPVMIILGAMREGVPSPDHPAVIPVLGLILLVFLACIILHILDLRLRTYQVFNDVVVYTEGFLTRENAFIPYENIADASTQCSFVDRILGLYDVRISCQGSGTEIKFRRLRNGPGLTSAIEGIVLQARRKPKSPGRAVAQNPDAPVKAHPSRVEPDEIPATEMFTSELRMHPVRMLVPLLLLLPFFPLWLLAMIQASIRLSCTTYSIRMGSLRQSFRFLTVDEREFAYDKITGLVVMRNLWDRMFNTMTLKFWSIGSGRPVEFAHIHRDEVDLPRLMRQVGIPAASTQPHDVQACFSPPAWLRAKIYPIAFLLVLAAIIVGVALATDPLVHLLVLIPAICLVSSLIHSSLYHSRQRLRFHQHHVEAEQGVVVKKCFYARYKNIKRIMTTRYPGGGEGDLRIFVAGEEENVQFTTPKKNQKPRLKQCHFTSSMLPVISQTGLLADQILIGRVDPTPHATPAAEEDVLFESSRSVSNAIVRLGLISLLLFPLFLLLPITIPLTIFRIKRWHYRLEESRVVIRWGVIYSKQTSVILDRVDSIEQNQGPLNKLFKNGNVSIMTAGSSNPDLVLIDTPDYFRLYDQIRSMTR